MRDEKLPENYTLTRVPGLLVGHWTDKGKSSCGSSMSEGLLDVSKRLIPPLMGGNKREGDRIAVVGQACPKDCLT